MKKIIYSLLVFSILFTIAAFLGGTPSSARGFYYLFWLGVSFIFWKKRELFLAYVQERTYGGFLLFVGLGVLMILIEETIAAIAVNIFHVHSISELLVSITQYYFNNLLLLSGFIVAWYFLIKRYYYTNKEVFILVGLFGLFSEKIYVHILSFPILGIALILPTMFTYMGIIAPSLISVTSRGTKELSRIPRYIIGLSFPIIVSIPFVLIHAILTKIGFIDPSILIK